ncbi:hypothetical protein NO1_1426 [Candidatus Termititenax aidoneus]|uniref:Uncharacterized protein n=1 Tax=Termititenax aidoneus TaxID=2218524 RepID=A0A388TC73_TERA1|nr:hypothetical protein NO1_1426 [Candidatus Termititenax aidoneus]
MGGEMATRFWFAGNSFKGGKGKNYLRLHKDIVTSFDLLQKFFCMNRHAKQIAGGNNFCNDKCIT